MKSTELRLNNWVNCYGINFPVTAINHTHVEGAANDGEFLISDLQPIPLTFEILNNSCKSWRTFHDGVIIFEFGIFDFWSQNGSLWLDREWNSKILPDNIESVHQLQNLYYILMGE